MIWWRDKGVKDEVKQARRAKRVAEGHQLEIRAQRAPRFLVLYKYVDKLQQLHSTDILFICGNCTLIGRRAVPECLFWTALANVNSCQKKTGFDNTGRNIGAHNSTCSLFQFLLAQMHSTAQMHSCEVNCRWDFGDGRDEDGDCSRSKGFKGLSSCILSGAFHIDMPDAGWMFQVICKILLFKL